MKHKYNTHIDNINNLKIILINSNKYNSCNNYLKIIKEKHQQKKKKQFLKKNKQVIIKV